MPATETKRCEKCRKFISDDPELVRAGKVCNCGIKGIESLSYRPPAREPVRDWSQIVGMIGVGEDITRNEANILKRYVDQCVKESDIDRLTHQVWDGKDIEQGLETMLHGRTISKATGHNLIKMLRQNIDEKDESVIITKQHADSLIALCEWFKGMIDAADIPESPTRSDELTTGYCDELMEDLKR